MKIAAVLNIHSNPNCVNDTIDSLKAFVTNDILVVVDGAKWDELKHCNFQAAKIKGFYHNKPKSPYRNVALGLKTIFETMYADWYLYCEYDVLFASTRYRHNLELAKNKEIWMLGNDGHVDALAMPLIQSIIGESLTQCYYLLGCCQFFHRNFLEKLQEIDFFEKFLSLTNNFADGFFPFYSGYDLSEHMYPTLCRHFGGNIGVLATYDQDGKWHGAYEHFLCRWKPEITEEEPYKNASIIHPVKQEGSIRNYHKEKRNIWMNSPERVKLLESF